MKIHINRESFTKRSVLFVCFFASMFIFASFTKEDRQKVRSFKLRMMDKYVYHPAKDNINSSESPVHAGTEHKNPDIVKRKNSEVLRPESLSNVLFSENKEADHIFNSEEKQGIIGEFSDDESDNAGDNFFTITIPEVAKQGVKAYLVYDLFGLESYHSVSRSINKNIAFGGNIIVAGSKWSSQKEEIPLNSLEKGKNTILFTSSLNGVKYKVKNVKIIFENNLKSTDHISSLLSGNSLYIKGIENGPVHINDKSVSSVKGEYESLIELSEADKAKGSVTITTPGGVREYKIPESRTSFKTLSEEKYVPATITVSKDTEHTGSYEKSTLYIEKNSVENTAQVQVLKLRKKDFPAISGEIKNMTPNSGAYRLENRTGEFTKKMRFSFPYDEKKLGARSAKEIKAFYFDYTLKKWRVDPTGKVDTEKKVITVETKGDTDYINGVISVPESSKLDAFAPTSISGLKAADPTAGLQLMAVPAATQKGDASASYPIRVPAGIGGLQPSVSIDYSSAGGNGWMGDGWNISGLSSITVDTKWGTPLFDGAKETELYSFDGEMLVYPNEYLPHRHNDVSENNAAITTEKQLRTSYTNNTVKQFYLRKNHDFTLIERIGTSPNNYTWKVTSTDGTKRYYGGSSDSVLYGSGGIAHWGLRLIEDAHGNTMEFTYYNEPGGGGTFYQIKKIAYGKNKDYTVNFNKETSITRQDITTNAKQGLIRSEPYLLKSVEVKYKTELVRTYKLDYVEGEFFKTLLKRIYIVPNNPCSTTLPLARSAGENKEPESGNMESQGSTSRERDMDDGSGGGGGGPGGIEPTCNEISDSYTFEYYNDVKDGQGNVRIFGPDTGIALENDKEAYSGFVRSLVKPSKINGNISSETGFNIRLAAGLNFFTPSSDAYGHLMFGFPFGNSSAKARNAQQLVDFNGDGIQDMIYRVPDEGLFLRTGKLDDAGNLSFNKSERIGNYPGGDFSYTETSTSNSGWDMGAMIYSKSEISSSTQGTTKTYLIDANSDGLMDIVNNGQVWFNRFSSGKSEMTQHSEYTENMVVKAKAIQAPVRECGDPGEFSYPCPDEPVENPININDVVKVWVAPRDGYVRFEDTVSLATSAFDRSGSMYYSVEIKNPTPMSGTTDTFTNTRIFLQKILAPTGDVNVVINKYNDHYSEMQLVDVDSNYGVPNGINNPDRLFVKSGEKIYVRVHKNISKDVVVNSNPTITYVDQHGNDIPNTIELSQDQFQLSNGPYGFNFLLNNASAPILLDAPGTVAINIPSITFPYLSDDIKFRVVTEKVNSGAITDLITPEIYNQLNLTTQPHTLNLTVNAGEPVYLRFIVESDSFTNFKDVNWNGQITVNYNASVNYGTGNAVVNWQGVAEYPSFVVTQLAPQLDINNVSNNILLSGTHNFGVQINKNVNFSSLATGSFYYIIKKKNQVLAKRRVIVSHTNNTLIEEDMIAGQPVNGVAPVVFYSGVVPFLATNTDHLVTVEVYCKTAGDYALFNKYSEYFSGKPFNVYYDNTNFYGTTTATAVNTAMYNSKSFFFNNWGQFVYKAGSLSNYLYGWPINFGAFGTPTANQNTYPACQNPNIVNNQEALANCILNETPNPNVGNNAISSAVTSMKPAYVRIGKSNTGVWAGSAPSQYSSPFSFSTYDNANYFTDPVPSVPTTSPTTYVSGQLSVDTTMKAIDKDQRSRSRNKTQGGSLGPVSGGNSITDLDYSVENQTFSDMNGDGYPDIVYPRSMQFTNSTGSLEDIKANSYGEPTQSLSYQKNNSAGFSYNTFSVTGRIGAHGNNGTRTQPDTGIPWSGSASVGASLNQYYDSFDAGGAFWMDINGDGLPDRVTGGHTQYMRVALNLGKSIGSASAYPNILTYRSHPKGAASISLGGGLGSSANLGALSSFGFGISAGVSASASTGSADVVYEDINGDGLIDILEVAANGATTVRYNLGNKFDTGVPLVKSSGNIDFSDETKSYNGSFSFGGSYMFNIGPITLIPPVVILILWVKAGGGANVNLGMNVTETRKTFRDMNGDGFTDLVQDTNSGFIVNYSKIGRTNKLKSITNSFSKGTYVMDYQISRANYDNPYAKLIVKDISVLNPDVFSSGYTTENGTKMETRYEFRNRKYDRREREDFGFETVIKKEINNGSTERISTDLYFNNTYLLNGLIKQSTVQSGNGNYLSDVKYNYKLRKFMYGTTLINLNSDLPFDYDSGGREGRKMGIALLDEKIKTAYESGGSIVTQEKFTYTTKGLMEKYQYTSPSISYNTRITYQAIDNNIIGVPALVEVYEGTTNSQLLRKRSAENINLSNGDVGRYNIFDGNNNITTDLLYNTAGNIIKITYPPNNNTSAVQRYSIDYTYDDAVTGKYVLEVKDIFNIKSSATYNPLFDVVTRKVDTGGNAMVFTYDGFGRTRTIMGPNEIASGATVPTVKYKYWFDHADIANSDSAVKLYRASTSNYDPEYASSGNTIMTDTYSDFLGRIVQTKKDFEWSGNESRAVSGRTVYDGLGRAVRQFHPVMEAVTNQALNSASSGASTTNEYDSRDRVVAFTDEDGVTTKTSYSIDQGLFKTTQEISSQKSETYTNAEGKVVQKNDYLDMTPLSTFFTYNTVGELVEVKDPEGIKTQYSYDLAGRRVEQIHPDKGRTVYEYDPSGNLVTLETENLVNDPTINTHVIKYNYDYNRLVGIVLPDLPSGDPNPNNVTYEYYPSTPGNNAGKLRVKDEGSGSTKYTYGRMGEVLSEVRVIRGYHIPEMYFKTSFNYDSWNRITKIKYPDDEIVFYHYDKGGMLKSVDNNSGEIYINNAKYDYHDQRLSIVYGNGISQSYGYNPHNRKLDYYNLMTPSTSMLQNSYKYDEFSNVIKITNVAYPLGNGMGGAFDFDFGYDTLNRLTGTRTGKLIPDKEGQPIPSSNLSPSTNELEMHYNNAGGIISKRQHHERDQAVVPENTYENHYNYIDGTHKLKNVDDSLTGNNEVFEYDYNGNTVAHTDQNGTRKMFWDEQDRMRAIYNDNTGTYQYYTYDDTGERAIKYGLEVPALLYQNGAPVGLDDVRLIDFKLYPNPYITVSSSGQYTKHYFDGSKRFASRLIDGITRFEDPSVLYTSRTAAEPSEKKADAEADFKKYLEKTDLGGNVSVELREMYQSPGLYYLHGDHLGTATFVTNSHGDATQFFLNLPFGETMLEQMDGSYNNPYKFNGKELDEDTGLYYYGARYYNPRLSIWYGVDPLAEKYPELSPYVYTANNPVKYTDPDGQDFILAILGMFRKDRTVSKMEVRATVYITGEKASAARAKELNVLAKETFKSKKVDGAEVGFNVKYVYKKNINSSDLKDGENILNLVNTAGRSEVNGYISEDQFDGEITHYTGNTGTIYSDGDNMTIMHETGHFLGLPDRYTDTKDKKGNIFSKAHPGFVGDLMGDKGKKLNSNYYKDYLKRANENKGKDAPSYIQIGRDKKGNLVKQ
ncbi:SpvB/TcaC N-terminal domain-containing protein [Chryseobacterium flavum]|uniref:SpvB/TcaC N-terminal domain-containing protein n=1 Tax=Chryseobacterium flavum TaxID=415851 RepID=UPI0028AB28BD|nr:SpvB/TcaC N-terminal domain-containing protein [Chryseobacterium flavum]